MTALNESGKPISQKPKINKTNRILLRYGVIYCSGEIITRTKHLLVRCEQRFAPKKDAYDELMSLLVTLKHSHPNHFPESSKRQIG